MKFITRYNRLNLPVMAFILILSSVASYYLIRQAIQDELDKSLYRVQKRIGEYVQTHQRLPEITSFDDQKIRFEKVTGSLPPPTFRTNAEYIPEQNKLHLSRQFTYPLVANNQRYRVVITDALEGTRHVTRVVLIITMATILLVVLASALFNRFVLSRFWRPFYESLGLVRSFKIDRQEPLPFPQTPIEEFSYMIDNLRTTTSRATEDYQALKEFTENASHEIQTPLAIIRSKLDLLIQYEGFPEEQTESLKSAYKAVRKLSLLNQSLLLLTKIDNRQFDNKTTVNLQDKLKEKILQFQELWQNKEIELSASLKEVAIEANPELVDILLNNVLSNATRHNIPHGVIDIDLAARCMQVSNTGLPQPLDQERLFRRFYKASNNSEHNGLGLSIIKQICEASGIQYAYRFTKNQHAFVFSW